MHNAYGGASNNYLNSVEFKQPPFQENGEREVSATNLILNLILQINPSLVIKVKWNKIPTFVAMHHSGCIIGGQSTFDAGLFVFLIIYLFGVIYPTNPMNYYHL